VTGCDAAITARASAHWRLRGDPRQDTVPASFNVRAYLTHEAHGVISLWLGDGALADPALIPDWRLNADPEWAAVRGLHRMPANYQLVLDNLLDLTHVAFIHKMLGGPGITENPLELASRAMSCRPNA